MPTTYPNQKIIKIHRERAASDFLGIENENWQAAARDLGAHALMLYLYFASNKDNYLLALSPTAIETAVGMPRSTYRDQFSKLINRGYLVASGGYSYDFYETPRAAQPAKTAQAATVLNFEDDTSAVQDKASAANSEPSEDIEINIDIINNQINSGQGKQVPPAPLEEFKF